MERRTAVSYRSLIADDVDLLPLMSVFVAIIPMLLVSAILLKVSVVKVGLPGEGPAVEGAAAPPAEIVVRVESDFIVAERSGRDPIRVPRDERFHIALRAALSALAAGEEPPVVIASRPETRYAYLVAVMDQAREVGLPDVSLARAAER